MRKNLYLILFFAFFFWGCKKEDTKTSNLLHFVGTYTSGTVAEAGEPKMYTSTGVVLDKGKIKAALDLIGYGADLLNSVQSTVAPGLLNLTVRENGEADVTVKNAFGTSTFTGKFEDIQSDEVIIRKSVPDTTFLPYNPYSFLQVQKPIQPLNLFNGRSTASGYSGDGLLIGRKRLRLVIRNNELYLPILAYAGETYGQEKVIKEACLGFMKAVYTI